MGIQYFNRGATPASTTQNIGCPSIITPSKMGKTKNLIVYSLIWYFVNNCPIKVQIYLLLHICATYKLWYNCAYLPDTIFCFCLIVFQLITDSPPQFCVFTVKSPGATQRRFLKEMLLKRAKTHRLLFSKLQAEIFFLIENIFRFFR